MPARVLWIEDEGERCLSDYASPVIMAGYFLEIVVDATEAARRLRDNRYDVVIFDLIIKAGADEKWQKLDKECVDREQGPYLGLQLLRAIFAPNRSNVRLQIPEGNLTPQDVAVLTVVENPEVHEEIRSLGVTRVYLKAKSDLTVLKGIIDETLEQKGN